MLYDSDKDGTRVQLDDILSHRLIFIVAEPGQGKTRLVDELVGRAGEDVIKIDLKTRISSEKFGDWLAINGMADNIKTIFLDGLDESPANDIMATIYSILGYIKTNPDRSFYISCRVHYFSKYQTLFSELDGAEYLLINPLERRKAKDFLTNLGVSDGSIKALFDSLTTRNQQGSTILQNPRYLEMIAKEVVKPGFNIEHLNRSNLFSSFIRDALIVEDTKAMKQLAEYKQRFLEHLALTMEVAQTSEISSDDFVTFIERADQGTISIIGREGIEHIYEHSLISKDINGMISFTNTEIQEYLAAKYISRMANPLRKLFSLAFEPNMRRLIPSWRNTVSYMIDDQPEIARFILDAKSTIDSVDEGTELLVTGSTSEKLQESDKSYLFEYIWSMNNRNAAFIDRDVSFNLARYADSSQITDTANSFLKMKSTKSLRTKYINHIIFIGNVILLRRVPSQVEQQVIEKLLRIALNRKDSSVQYNAIHVPLHLN